MVKRINYAATWLLNYDVGILKIIHMVGIKRGCGSFYTNKGMQLVSLADPQFKEPGTLYVWGTSTDKDGEALFFKNRDVFDSVLKLLSEFNEEESNKKMPECWEGFTVTPISAFDHTLYTCPPGEVGNGTNLALLISDTRYRGLLYCNRKGTRLFSRNHRDVNIEADGAKLLGVLWYKEEVCYGV